MKVIKESETFLKHVEEAKQCAEESLTNSLEGVASALKHLSVLNAVLVEMKRKGHRQANKR
jgi:hypothetical protein